MRKKIGHLSCCAKLLMDSNSKTCLKLGAGPPKILIVPRNHNNSKMLFPCDILIIKTLPRHARAQQIFGDILEFTHKNIPVTVSNFENRTKSAESLHLIGFFY